MIQINQTDIHLFINEIVRLIWIEQSTGHKSVKFAISGKDGVINNRNELIFFVH